jgi:hypothetical protein
MSNEGGRQLKSGVFGVQNNAPVQTDVMGAS